MHETEQKQEPRIESLKLDNVLTDTGDPERLLIALRQDLCLALDCMSYPDTIPGGGYFSILPIMGHWLACGALKISATHYLS